MQFNSYKKSANLKKLITIALLILVCNAAYAYDGYGKKRQPYSIAFHFSNPLGILSKYGGGLEYRFHGTSVLYDYYKYNAVFPGIQQTVQLQFFLRSRTRHELFLYVKGVAGDASYDGSQLGFLNYNTTIILPDQSYFGGGGGIGKRFNFNHLFLVLSGGFKVCVPTSSDFDTDQKNLYKLFYETGPGAVLDLHLQFGFQF